MSEYKRYRRTQIAEMADWTPGFDMTDVSISAADLKAGSPKPGDKIARNPANHEDRWLVAQDYFEANFEAVSGWWCRYGVFHDWNTGACDCPESGPADRQMEVMPAQAMPQAPAAGAATPAPPPGPGTSL